MKRLLPFILIFLCLNVFAQIPWTQKASLFPGRGSAVGFSIGGYGYIGLGADFSTFYSDFWKFDTLLNAWTQVASFPPGNRNSAVAFVINNKGYVGTGITVDSLLGYIDNNDLWEYDPSLNSWVQKASLPSYERSAAIGFSIVSKGYIGTGINSAFPSTVLKDFWEYDPLTNSWLQRADIGINSRYGAYSFAIYGKGYVGSGWGDLVGNYDDLLEYDVAQDTWTQKASWHARAYAISFSIGDKGYVGTGVDTAVDFNDFWEYYPDSDRWTQKANFPAGIRAGCSGFVIGNKSFLGIGGHGANIYSDFWEYNPSMDTVNGFNEIYFNRINFEVFPNPCNGLFTIKVDKNITYSINIFDLTGKQVFARNFEKQKRILVDLTNQRNGLYCISLKLNNNILFVKKVLVNH